MNIINKKYLIAKYWDLINDKNILKIWKYNINKFLKNEPLKNEYLTMVFNIWANENYELSRSFFSKCKKLIRKLNLNILPIDKHDLDLLEERIFSLDRHIKILLVEMDLETDEVAGIKFENTNFFVKENKLKLLNSGILIITNKRIIIKNYESISTYRWTKVKNIKYNDYGFEFSYNKTTFLVRIHDQITLNNTIKNFLSKKGM